MVFRVSSIKTIAAEFWKEKILAGSETVSFTSLDTINRPIPSCYHVVFGGCVDAFRRRDGHEVPKY